MQNQVINRKIQNDYMIGTIELQALKKLFENNLVTEKDYKLLKQKITKEYHILM